MQIDEEEQKEMYKQQELLVNHMSRTLSNPQSKEQAKQLEKFTKLLSENSQGEPLKGAQTREDLKWSDDALAKLKRLEGRS